jgi:hypothetical protein
MGRYTDLTVVLDDIIDPDWGNLVRNSVRLPFATSAARTSELPALGAGDAGMSSFLVDDKRVDTWSGSAWELETFIPAYRWVDKAIDESVSNTAAQNDDHLVLALTPGAVTGAKYHITGRMYVTGNAAYDIIPLFTLPTGATMDVANSGLQFGVTGSDTYGYVEKVARLAQSSPTLGVTYATSGGVTTLELDGIVTMATTAGNIQLQWAPGSTGSITVKKGSWMQAARKS